MTASVDALGDDLRKIGIYVDHHDFVDLGDEGGRILVLDAQIGDVAFSDRVQNPAKASDDRAVRAMDIDLHRSDFDDAREGIRRRLLEGRPVLGDDS